MSLMWLETGVEVVVVEFRFEIIAHLITRFSKHPAIHPRRDNSFLRCCLSRYDSVNA